MVDYVQWLNNNIDWLSSLVIISIFTLITIWYYVKFDKYEKEPKWRMITAFLLGLVSVIPAIIFELIMISIFPNLPHSIVVAPFIEELSKGFFVVLLARWDEMDGPLDGMVYGGLIGAGFAGAENLLYAYHSLAASGLTASIVTASFRSVFQIVGHPFFTAMTGYGVGAAKVGLGRFRWGAVWKAMLAHAFWNTTAALPGFLSVLGLIVVAIVYIWYLRRVFRKAQEIDLDAANRGYYKRDDIPYVLGK